MRTITIVNLTREQLVLNLPSNIVPEMSQPAPARERRPPPAIVRRGGPSGRLVPAPGAAKPAMRQARLSGSITLNAKGTPGASVTVPLASRRAPDVQAALAAHKIRIDTIKEPPKPPAPVPAVARRIGKPALPTPGKDG